MAAEQEIIGLTGGMCSGKDSWADLFHDQFGHVHRSTSDVARNYIRENDLGEPTRDRTRETATYLRNQFGADYLMRKAIESAGDSERVVISGIYVVPEALYLLRIGGSIINISTDEAQSFDRMSNRGRAGEAPELDEFHRLMNNDLHSEQTDQRLADVISLADYSIDGNVSIHDTEIRHKMAEKVLLLIAEKGRQ